MIHLENIGTMEVRRGQYGTENQYHVDFRDTSGKVTRTSPAPAWSYDLYQWYLDALQRAELAEEKLEEATRADRSGVATE